MTSTYYPVVKTSKGTRYHRATCKRVNPEQVIGDVTTVSEAEMGDPATCCKPIAMEAGRQRTEAFMKGETARAEMTIEQAVTAVKSATPADQAPVEAQEAPKAAKTTGNARRDLAREKAKERGHQRGFGRTVSDEELDAYIVKAHGENPDSPRVDELWYARWVEGIAVSRERWIAAWDRSTATTSPKAAAV